MGCFVRRYQRCAPPADDGGRSGLRATSLPAALSRARTGRSGEAGERAPGGEALVAGLAIGVSTEAMAAGRNGRRWGRRRRGSAARAPAALPPAAPGAPGPGGARAGAVGRAPPRPSGSVFACPRHHQPRRARSGACSGSTRRRAALRAYTRALAAFRRHGPGGQAEAGAEAVATNPFVPAYLLGRKKRRVRCPPTSASAMRPRRSPTSRKRRRAGCAAAGPGWLAAALARNAPPASTVKSRRPRRK